MSDELLTAEEEDPLSKRVGSFVSDLLEELQTEENLDEQMRTLQEFMRGYLQLSSLLELPALGYLLLPADSGFRNVLCGHTMASSAPSDWRMLLEDLTSRLNETTNQARK